MNHSFTTAENIFLKKDRLEWTVLQVNYILIKWISSVAIVPFGYSQAFYKTTLTALRVFVFSPHTCVMPASSLGFLFPVATGWQQIPLTIPHQTSLTQTNSSSYSEQCPSIVPTCASFWQRAWIKLLPYWWGTGWCFMMDKGSMFLLFSFADSL